MFFCSCCHHDGTNVKQQLEHDPFRGHVNQQSFPPCHTMTQRERWRIQHRIYVVFHMEHTTCQGNKLLLHLSEQTKRGVDTMSLMRSNLELLRACIA